MLLVTCAVPFLILRALELNCVLRGIQAIHTDEESQWFDVARAFAVA